MIPKNLIPEGMRYFIAGGWAVCPALATDRDLFVQTTGDLTDTRAMLLDHMRAQGFDLVEEGDENGIPTLDLIRTDYIMVEVMKVAKVSQKFAQDIHVLLTTGDVADVLNSFDLSVCQIAITETGKIVRGDYYTHPYKPIYVVNDTPDDSGSSSKV